MADLKLDIIVVPTYSTYNIAVVDISTYPTDPPVVDTPWIEIQVPAFGAYGGAFTVGGVNVFNSTDLGITEEGSEIPIPDGIYRFKYTVTPAFENYVEKTIMRVDQLQEKFDRAFMKLDMMECDGALKAQVKVEINTIYFLIQGAIAAANDCATVQAQKLYDQANKMLNNINNCGYSVNNCIINFQ
jgi:hypothetical protein